jgi:glucose/arabinose dehydrogenase
LFVSDQGGIIYKISGGKYSIFLDLREHIPDFSIGPGIATGLGSFDFHPDYLKNGLIYITHAEKYRGQTPDYRVSDSLMAEVQWVVSEWKMDDVNSPVFKGTRRELLRLHAPTFGHGAQDLAFSPDLPRGNSNHGLLYWGFGDGGSNNVRRPDMGHRRTSFLGSILRIDPLGHNSRNGNYGIPADNPFAADTTRGTIREVYAYGFRNPHRMAWDAENNHRMIVTDIGESNIEEINIVEKGGDYGWPAREGTFGITTTKDLKRVYPLQPADADLYKKPFVQYDHTDGFAISGGYVYDGDIQALKNKYIFGDIVNGRLFYVNISPQLRDSTIYELAISKDGRETTLREMSGIKRLHLRIGYDRFSKQLYVITKADGRIYRVAGF